MKCALCNNDTKEGEKLCSSCDFARLSAASVERILSGSGLTWRNSQEYSEEEWIKFVMEIRGG